VAPRLPVTTPPPQRLTLRELLDSMSGAVLEQS
jgi:hypothetical protein